MRGCGFFLLLTILFIFSLDHVKTRLICSSNPSCRCTFLNSTNKIQANCSSLNLTDSPIFFENVISVILYNNQLKKVPNGSYLPNNILHLNLSYNEIRDFTNRPFVGLYDLLFLDLSYNRIPLTTTVYYEDVFMDLKSLKYLDIQYNVYSDAAKYPGGALSHVSALENLRTDLYKNQTFGKQFSNLTRLRYLEIGNCSINTIDQHFFDNLPFLKKFQINQCRVNLTVFSLRTIEAGAFAKLKSLEYLDVSRNRLLGFCALRNIANDLPHTAIKVLKAAHIHCPYGQSTVLLNDDLKPLNETKLEELYLDSNKLEMTETWAPSFLPKTLRVLGISDNRWSLQPYAYKGIQNLTGLSEIDLRYQEKSQIDELGNYWFCEDFYSINKCVGKRMANDKERWFEEPVNDCKNTSKEIKHVTECVFNDSTCYGFYRLIIPPNVKIIHFDKSELGNAIPPHYFSDDVLTNLSLSENNLHRWTGPLCNLTALRHLDLSKNKCSYVTEYFFIGLTGLMTLKLNENELGLAFSKNKGMEFFKSQIELRFLNLSTNKIRSLWETSFKGLRNIEYLDLSNNLLYQWDASISHMRNLSYIDLSRNQILYLSEHSMKNLDRHHKNIEINLLNNHFKCTCDSLKFLKWLTTRMSISFIDREKYTCQTDNMHVYSIPDAISMLSSKCSPNYWLIAGMVVLSVLIIVSATIIIYKYRWKIMYYRYVVLSKGSQRGYELLHSRKYDAFVSYADEDRDFVHEELIERLENGEDRKLKLCIHMRDFIPGTAIADNITNAIHNSSRTICIISSSFLRSHWCKFEFNMALTEGVESRQDENVVILLFLEDVPKKLLPLNMLAIRNNNNCFDIHDGTHTDEKWALLLDTIPQREPETVSQMT